MHKSAIMNNPMDITRTISIRTTATVNTEYRINLSLSYKMSKYHLLVNPISRLSDFPDIEIKLKSRSPNGTDTMKRMMTASMIKE